MTDLKVFEFEKQAVRVELVDGESWFCLSDVCSILGIENPSRVAHETLKGKGVITLRIAEGKGNPEKNFVSEAALYKVVFLSRKPEAEKFTDWIASEVIPSIRKTGSYSLPKSIEERSVELIADMLKVIKGQEKKITEDKPKVEFFEAVCSSKDCMDIGSAAKALNMGVGRNTLFEFLRQKGVLMSNNQPFQRFVDYGYFRVVEQKFQTPDGEIHINLKTMVYQPGLNYIRNLWGGYIGEKREQTRLVQGA